MFEARALGSALRMFVAPDGSDRRGPRPLTAARARDAWAAVNGEFDAVDRALSRFRDDSELTGLNRRAGTGEIVMVSWRLRMALAAMDRARRITDGRFDASLLDALERIGEHGATLDAEATRAMGSVDPHGSADPEPSTTLHRPRPVRAPDSPLDTGGIGKGLALRWAVARATSITPGAGLLLEAGGDLVSAGRAPDGGWQVGIEDPVSPAGPDAPPLAVIALWAGAVATSSIGVRNWTAPDGRRVHHLLDPRTREPARTGLLAVTVAGADPAWSEVWSKALFLAGRASIGGEARSRGLAAWWVDDAGRLGMTPDARIRSAWVAENRLG